MNEKNFGLVVLGGVILLYTVGSGLLEKLGLKESAEGRTIKQTLSSSDSPFSPLFYKNLIKSIGTFKVSNTATCENWATILYKAGEGFGTDEEAIFGVLRSCASKAHVSYLANYFGNKYNKSLVDFLASEFNEAEMTQAIKIVNSLPNYIK